jgi:hypothetical protein
VRGAFSSRRTLGFERGLSLFLAMYLLGLVGALLGIHVLQPDRGGVHHTPRSAAYPRG